MTVFDQRGQNVVYQYNAAGSINFGVVQNKVDVQQELEKLKDETDNAVRSGALDEEIAIDVRSCVEKAIIQVKKEEPDKSTIIKNLKEAKKIIADIATVAGFALGLTEAIKMIQRLF